MADNVNSDALLGQILPTVYIKEIAIKENGDRNKAELKLVVRDIVEKNEESSWFFNSDFTQFVNIKIIQSTNLNLTNALIQTQYFFESPYYTPSELQPYLKHSKVISLDMQKDNLDLKDYATTKNQNGERIYEIDYETSFDVDKDLSHLTFFAFAVMDIAQMSDSYGVSFNGYSAPRGNITQELVISQGAVNTTSYIYFIEETNQVWTGPFHTHEDGTLMTGQVMSPSSRTLRREEVPNVKVKDYTEKVTLSQSLPDLKPALRQFQKVTKKLLNRDQLNFDIQSSYISQGQVSPTRDAKVNLLFHFDMRKFIRENSAFGSIFDTISNEVAKEQMYLSSKIKKIQITRRRVSKTQSIDKLGTNTNSFLFDSSRNMDRVLVNSYDLEDGQIEDIENENASLQEISNLLFSGEVRTFTATDHQMKDITDGFYQYGVNIEVEDGVITVLNQKLDNLIDAKKEFDLYYSDATSKRYISKDGSFSFLLEKKYKNLARSQRKKQRRLSRRLRSSDIEEMYPWNKAIAAFVDAYTTVTTLPGTLPGLPQPVIGKLYSMINPTTGTDGGVFEFNNLLTNLIDQFENTLGSKRTSKQSSQNNSKAKTRTISRVSSLFTEKKFKEIHDSNVPRNFGFDFIGKKSRKEQGIKAISFNDLFKRSEEELEMFWKTTDVNTISETLRTEEQGGELTQEEKDGLLDMKTTRLSYFTPANISAGSISVNRLNAGSGLFNPVNYNALAANIVALNSKNFTSLANPNLLSDPSKTNAKETNNSVSNLQQSAVENILSQLSVTITSPSEVASEISIPFEKYLTIKDLVGTGDPLVTIINNSDYSESETDNEERKIRMARSGKSTAKRENSIAISNIFMRGLSTTDTLSDTKESSKISNFKPSIRRGIRDYNLFSSRNVLDKMRNSPLTKKQLQSVPNQVKSLMFSKSETTKNNWQSLEVDPLSSPETTQMMRYNFDTIAEIRVFKGFEKDKEGNNLIMKPVYKLLTDEDLQESKNGVLLCKMDQYKNGILGIGENIKMNMKIYDNVFILSPDDKLLKTRLKRTAKQQQKLIDERSTKVDTKYLKYASSAPPIGTEKVEQEYFATTISTNTRGNR